MKYIFIFIIFASSITFAGDSNENKDFFWVDEGLKSQNLFERSLKEIGEEGVHVRMRVRFDLGSFTIAENSYPILDAFGRVMDEALKPENNDKFRIVVSGHTDNEGEEDENLALSEKRAMAVANYLIGYYSFVMSNFSIEAHGESMPIDTNETAQGRRNNRRVEFSIYKYREENVKIK